MKTILVVEDEDVLNSVLTAEFQEAGYTVLSARDGEEAISIVKEKKPDLVFLDLLLPKKDGLQVIIELKQDPETKHIPIVANTASVNNLDSSKYLEAGAVLFLVKQKDTPAQLKKIAKDYFTNKKMS